jgi:protein-disulfide isomerase
VVGQWVWNTSCARTGSGRISSEGVTDARPGGTDAGALAEMMGLPGGPIELDGTEQILGDPEAPYLVVEWADYGCPHCAMAAKELKILVQERPDIQVRFKTFPLSGACNPLIERQEGAERCKAAWAAECAGLQGRFWDLQALIFANQTHISDEDLAYMAEQAGLDFPAWEACMQDPSVMEGVVQDAIAGAKAGVQGTPALFLAGVLPGGQFVESCRGPAGVLELVEAHKAGTPLPSPQPSCFDPHGH